MLKEITIPDIGNYHGVEIIELMMSEGKTINKEDPLLTLETEKASVEVPSPFTGTLKQVKVKVGDKVSQGDLIAMIEVSDTQASSSAKNEPKSQDKSTATSKDTESVSKGSLSSNKDTSTLDVILKKNPEQEIKTQTGKGTGIGTETDEQTEDEIDEDSIEDSDLNKDEVHAGPATRRLARELGLSLNEIKGTGRHGRIVLTDVHGFVKSQLNNNNSGMSLEKLDQIDFSLFGDIESTPLSRIKKWTAKNLHRNWVTIPHVTQFDECDVEELELFRQENKALAESFGARLTPIVFIMKALVVALKAHPSFNASLSADGQSLILKKYYHLGIAVDTPAGLMVPVVRDVDKKGLFELAKDIIHLSKLAKEGKLKATDMQGSTFTISSLGSIGGTAFTPIINAPDVAILGLSKSQIKPVYQGDRFVPRLMLPLSLSYDHRVIDGAQGAQFLRTLISNLQDIRRLLF